MKITIDEDRLCRALAVRLDDPKFRAGVRTLANDPFFVAHFLASVSQGEGLGEAAVSTRDALGGRPYYVAVLEANRARLKQRDGYSRLNLYLTTTFAYEVMVVLLYRAVSDAIAASALPLRIRERVVSVLDGILAEEETHLAILDQHDLLLRASREPLSEDARAMLDSLEKLRDEDYEHPAGHAVEQVVAMMGRYRDPVRQRADIGAGRVPGE